MPSEDTEMQNPATGAHSHPPAPNIAALRNLSQLATALGTFLGDPDDTNLSLPPNINSASFRCLATPETANAYLGIGRWLETIAANLERAEKLSNQKDDLKFTWQPRRNRNGQKAATWSPDGVLNVLNSTTDAVSTFTAGLYKYKHSVGGKDFRSAIHLAEAANSGARCRVKELERLTIRKKSRR